MDSNMVQVYKYYVSGTCIHDLYMHIYAHCADNRECMSGNNVLPHMLILHLQDVHYNLCVW